MKTLASEHLLVALKKELAASTRGRKSECRKVKRQVALPEHAHQAMARTRTRGRLNMRTASSISLPVLITRVSSSSTSVSIVTIPNLINTKALEVGPLFFNIYIYGH